MFSNDTIYRKISILVCHFSKKYIFVLGMEGPVEALPKRRDAPSVSGPSSFRPQASNSKRRADEYTQKDDPEEKKAELELSDVVKTLTGLQTTIQGLREKESYFRTLRVSAESNLESLTKKRNHIEIYLREKLASRVGICRKSRDHKLNRIR